MCSTLTPTANLGIQISAVAARHCIRFLFLFSCVREFFSDDGLRSKSNDGVDACLRPGIFMQCAVCFRSVNSVMPAHVMTLFYPVWKFPSLEIGRCNQRGVFVLKGNWLSPCLYLTNSPSFIYCRPKPPVCFSSWRCLPSLWWAQYKRWKLGQYRYAK